MEMSDYDLISKNTREAYIYHKDGVVYKIYKLPVVKTHQAMVEHAKLMRDRKKKIAILKGITDLPNAVMPTNLVCDEFGNFMGYSMPYISDANHLADFSSISDSSKSFLNIISVCSRTLRLIHEHPAKLCVGDMHFYNILFDNCLVPYYIDCDSWSVGKIEGVVCSAEYIRFVKRKRRKCDISQNSDKISLFIYTYKYLFGNRIFECIDEYDYDELAEQSSFLRNSKEIFCKLSSKGFRISKIPYVDEFIDMDKPEEIVLLKKK